LIGEGHRITSSAGGGDEKKAEEDLSEVFHGMGVQS
jgi:phosphotransferase system HPr-like phosphotransfer protein